jgi:hypothetical protein
MSRDSHIFFTGDAFPHLAWSELLALYDASERPIDNFDRKRRITHKWWFPTADESEVHLTLRELSLERRDCFPRGFRWRVSIHASTGTTSEWFIYAIPILAAVRFPDTIFCDYSFVTCDLEGILLRAARVVPTRCDVEKLTRFGYIDGDSMWPTVLSERKAHPPTEQTREAARQFCADDKYAEFYPEIGNPNNQPMHAEGWWPTGAFITFLIALPVGLTIGIPYVWGLAIVGIIVSGLGFIMPRQSS